jgi:hypothetical protein
MTADVPPGAVGPAAAAPGPPSLDQVVEEAGRQRLASYYLFAALLAGLIGDGDLAPSRWPPRLGEPMQRLGLTRFSPRTERGLDVSLTAAEQAERRRPGRPREFARLLVDLINRGAFGPLCGKADSVRLAGPGDGGADLDLVKDDRVVGTCSVQDHWELVAQYLSGVLAAGPMAGTVIAPGTQQAVARQLKETGISHAVSLGITLAVNVHPLGAAAGIGTRLVRSRIRAGRDEAEDFRHLGQELSALRGQADVESDAVGAAR